ncbi:MAG: MBL fold metallo-hydrolase [Candidatus Poribacteria bacterium]
MSKLTEDFKIKFWGTRGSIPVPGSGTVKFGGNTSCVEIRCGKELIILDAGTGIKNLGSELLKEMPIKASIFFSHLHWDHIQGMPFFKPIYIQGNEFTFYGSKTWDIKLENALKGQMKNPIFPVNFDIVNSVGARVQYIDIDEGKIIKIGDKDPVTIQSIELYHTDKVFGFKIEYKGRSLVYATDTENLPEPNKKLIELAHSSDLIIHDAQYTSEEYYGSNGSSKRNWGHSTPEVAALVALKANTKRLVLFHHDPYHDDRIIEQIQQKASAIFPNTIAASESMVIEL